MRKTGSVVTKGWEAQGKKRRPAGKGSEGINKEKSGVSEVRRMEWSVKLKLYVCSDWLHVGSVYFLGGLHLASSFTWALSICWRSISPLAPLLLAVCFTLVVECLKPELIISTLVNLETKAGLFTDTHFHANCSVLKLPVDVMKEPYSQDGTYTLSTFLPGPCSESGSGFKTRTVRRGKEARVEDSGGGDLTCGTLPLDGKCFTKRPSDVEEGPSTRVQLINHISFLM